MKVTFLKHIDKGKVRHSYGSGRKSEKTIRQLLLSSGYSEKMIKAIHEENRILIRPKALSRKIKSTEELYVIPSEIDPSPQEVVEDNSLDRFKDL